MNIDTLEPGRSLFRDWENPRSHKLSRSIVDICPPSGVKAIAEGVEAKEIPEFLKTGAATWRKGTFMQSPCPFPGSKAMPLNGRGTQAFPRRENHISRGRIPPGRRIGKCATDQTCVRIPHCNTVGAGA